MDKEWLFQENIRLTRLSQELEEQKIEAGTGKTIRRKRSFQTAEKSFGNRISKTGRRQGNVSGGSKKV